MSEIFLKQIESEFNKLKYDLNNHKTGILEKLQSMLTDSINSNLTNKRK